MKRKTMRAGRIEISWTGVVIPTLREVQEAYVQMILNRKGGNKSQAAQELGLSVRTIYNYASRDDDETVEIPVDYDSPSMV